MSSGFSWFVLSQVFPSRVMAQTIASLLSAACIGIGFFVFTMSTLTPFDNMGVMTMKMMSITSMTSTIGVTLMSATGGGALCFMTMPSDSFFAICSLPGTRQEAGSPGGLPPKSTRRIRITGRLLAGAGAALRPLQEVVDQLGARVAHLHVERFDLVREEVEHPDRGNSHEQTDSGGHQRFGNAARDRAQAGRLLGRNSLERVDDADHRSEQTYERGGRADRRQAADAAL